MYWIHLHCQCCLWHFCIYFFPLFKLTARFSESIYHTDLLLNCLSYKLLCSYFQKLTNYFKMFRIIINSGKDSCDVSCQIIHCQNCPINLLIVISQNSVMKLRIFLNLQTLPWNTVFNDTSKYISTWSKWICEENFADSDNMLRLWHHKTLVSIPVCWQWLECDDNRVFTPF